MRTFHAHYSRLSDAHPEWGEVGCLPWDEDIFGFRVADFRIGAESPTPDAAAIFRAVLEEFAASTKAELVSSRLPVSATKLLGTFLRAGFMPVDLSLDAVKTGVRREAFPKPRFGVRKAEPEDFAEIYRIAATAFGFGRYHSDPRFPRELADRRYLQWMRDALSSDNPDDHVFVLGGPGQTLGFFHVLIRGGVADLRLAAGDPELKSALGYALYSETILAVERMGPRQYVARISASNVKVLNVYSALGFRFQNAKQVLHWHAPLAPHLL